MEQTERLNSIKEKISNAANHSDSEGNLDNVNIFAISNDIVWLCEIIEQQQQEIERLKEAEFKACSKHHEFIEEIETLEKDINMIKDLAVACDADERAIQPYEILGLLNTR